MLGQFCTTPGSVKNTYGTGCFLLMNTGTQPVQSKKGLLSTVCFQLGSFNSCSYALEGSISSGGVILRWLKDNLGLLDSAAQISKSCVAHLLRALLTSITDKLAASVEDNGGVYFVPALSGLFAPHWRPDARG